ncbi:hypothetical protein HID58_080077, partial [Brassica napus]
IRSLTLLVVSFLLSSLFPLFFGIVAASNSNGGGGEDYSINFDKMGKMFNIKINNNLQKSYEEPEKHYIYIQTITTDVAINTSSSSR